MKTFWLDAAVTAAGPWTQTRRRQARLPLCGGSLRRFESKFEFKTEQDRSRRCQYIQSFDIFFNFLHFLSLFQK